MLVNLDLAWLLMAVAIICIIAFMFGTALDHIMKDDGFGSSGNMILFVTGFFGAILTANNYGIHLGDLKLAVAVGLSGAFISIAVLALCKAAIARWA